MAKWGTFRWGTAKYGGDILWLFCRNINDVLNDTNRLYINYTDLNRIENRMREISDKLNNYKIKNDIITKTNWEKQVSTNIMTNQPIKSQLDRIRNNLQTLMTSYYVVPKTPAAPETLENLTIYKINALEKILYDLHVLIRNMENSWVYMGSDYYMGGVI